ncbi:DUF659 domain-containing protein [Bythopirellula goksoeyrii]|uniref:PEP-CTERM protein-sorting domain-containing protein n=1 Tax=Bythopirellula goksoeyrii TaxID=1400387 RepID=A0A5B9QAJ4_9BACT|nr:hypothetical protein [Bythopirellula goksoeyrii]QEG36007.1 hypothetical protein Pr1d_33160 [Bythopirellula goksoeyrii]
MRFALLWVLLISVISADASGASMVLRDSIGTDPSLSISDVGGATTHSGTDWATPGMVLNAPTKSYLTQVQILIFARDGEFLPENDLADILGYPMEFHLWSDGIQGGPDSFADNAAAEPSLPGHISVDVNSPAVSFITAEEFGTIGPPTDPNQFTTFLVTIDLSSFDIVLEAGEEYVVGVIQDNADNFVSGGGLFRQSSSTMTGLEDVFQIDQLPGFLLPGYLNSQLGLGVNQWAGTIMAATGDFDGDGDTDGSDFLKWQRDFGQDVATPGDGADGDGNGMVDAGDLRVWSLTHDQTPEVINTNVNSDFDGDGDTDGRDFLVWQRSFGQQVAVPGSGADGDGSGSVDDQDLQLWQDNYGGQDSAAIALPEPTNYLGLLLGTMLMCLAGLRHRGDAGCAQPEVNAPGDRCRFANLPRSPTAVPNRRLA